MHIREILRAGHVTRWHIVRTHRSQTIAEHMYLVAMIAVDMARRIGIHDERLGLITTWAMHHDLPEVLTGDVPTPAKLVIKRHIDYEETVEDCTSAAYRTLRREAMAIPEVDWIVKLADIMEAVNFLQNEGVRVDDPRTHAFEVLRGIQQSYRKAVAKAATACPTFPWHLLVDYREEIEESPVRQMVMPTEQ